MHFPRAGCFGFTSHWASGFTGSWSTTSAECLCVKCLPGEINEGRHPLICLRPGWFFSPDGSRLKEGILFSLPLCQRGVEVVRAVTGLWLGVLGARVCRHVWRPRGQCRVLRALVVEHWALCLQQGCLCSLFDYTGEPLVGGRGRTTYY